MPSWTDQPKSGYPLCLTIHTRLSVEAKWQDEDFNSEFEIGIIDHT